MDKLNLMDLFGGYSKENSLTTLDVIKDFAENCGFKIPIKGGLALNYLYETNQPSARNTIDIDYHFTSMEVWSEFKNFGVILANQNTKLDIKYKIVDCKVNTNGESLKIEFTSKFLNGKFSIDMNIGSYCTTVNIGKVLLYSPEMILADKISVICSTKIQRRSKDIYDIFLVACNENFELHELCYYIKQKLNSRNITLGELTLVKPQILKNLETGYRKIKLMDMPEFSEVSKLDLNFLLPILAFLRSGKVPNLYWNKDKKHWDNATIYGEIITRDLEGIICQESASGLLHLSTFPPYPILVYNDYVDLNMGIIRFIRSNDKSNIIKIRDNLYITNRERTVVDMILSGEYRILVESLITYKDEFGSLNNIRSMITDKEVLEQLDTIIRDEGL